MISSLHLFLYQDLLLLENYAVMNYCGFSKIVKKHDKLTGSVINLAVVCS